MNKEKILSFIVDFLEQKGKLPEDRTKLLNYRYLATGHIDSFGMVQLLMSIEEEFNIEIKRENLELISTIGGIVELTEQRIKEQHEGKIHKG